MTKTKVLIVEDNHELISIINGMLEDEGYETSSAQDVSLGYLTFLLFSPDVILTDIHLPGGDGQELMKHIRKHNPGIKTIYISGDISALREILEKEKGRYSIKILQKPFSREDLIKMLSEPHPRPSK